MSRRGEATFTQKEGDCKLARFTFHFASGIESLCIQQFDLLLLALCWSLSSSEDKVITPESSAGTQLVNGTELSVVRSLNGSEIGGLDGGNGTVNGTEERGILLGLLKGLHGGGGHG